MLSSIEQLKKISEEEYTTKNDYEYISDEMNASIVSSMTNSIANPREEQIEALFDLSNKRIFNLLDTDLRPMMVKFRGAIETSERVLSALSNNIRLIEEEIKDVDQYTHHTESNKNISGFDKFSSGFLMFFCVTIAITLAFIEVYFMHMYIYESLGGGDEESILKELGSVGVYIIGLIPPIISVTGFFDKNSVLNIKWIILLEIIWVFLFASTLFTFGSSATVMENLSLLLDTAFEIGSFASLFMVSAQTALISLIGFYLWSKARFFFDMTRIDEVTLNPAWKKLDKEMTLLNYEYTEIEVHKKIIEGKASAFESFKEQVISLNKISLYHHFQVFSHIVEEEFICLSELDHQKERMNIARINLADVQSRKLTFTKNFIDQIRKNQSSDTIVNRVTNKDELEAL